MVALSGFVEMFPLFMYETPTKFRFLERPKLCEGWWILVGRDCAEAGALGAGQILEGLSAMAKGTVKWFNTEKGFGFIQPEDGGKDIFVHITAVQAAGLQSLKDNQPIQYELIDGRDGRKSAGDLKI